MTKLLIDAGTSWSKILELYEDEDDLAKSPLNNYQNIIDLNDCEYKENKIFKDASGKALKGRLFIIQSNIFSKFDVSFDAATGHMVKKRIKPPGIYENEVIALAYGAKKMLSQPDLQNATIVDLGSRDVKWVQFKEGKYKDLDWNSNCGSVTGATADMLCKFYNINPCEISVEKERIPVICGVFAMEKIMDLIAADVSPEIAISRYIHGIAYNTWNFSRQPEKIYLSGGFCMNLCFVKSLQNYCDVVPLGRFVLLEGLY